MWKKIEFVLFCQSTFRHEPRCSIVYMVHWRKKIVFLQKWVFIEDNFLARYGSPFPILHLSTGTVFCAGPVHAASIFVCLYVHRSCCARKKAFFQWCNPLLLSLTLFLSPVFVCVCLCVCECAHKCVHACGFPWIPRRGIQWKHIRHLA